MNDVLSLLQPDPIVIEVVRQPPVTPEISYGGVLASAVGLVGVILLAALVVGVVVGGGIIWLKKRQDASDRPDEESHVRLRI